MEDSGARQMEEATRVVMLLREEKEDSKEKDSSASLLIAAQDMRWKSGGNGWSRICRGK